MVVLNVYSQSVFFKYKTYCCSKATFVVIVTSALTVLFPFIFTYKSHGFWMRSGEYKEQPDVSFKYDYILFADTDKANEIIICSNLPHFQHLSRDFNHCPFMKAREEDFNRDGLNDILHFSSKIIIPDGHAIYGISLLLFFDYKLSSYCRVQMEALGSVHYSSPIPGAGLSVVADLALTQRQCLRPRYLDTRHNTSILLPLSTLTFSLPELLGQYVLRNLSTHLVNVYSMWATQRVKDEPFTMDVTILYPEVTICYIPSTWQILRNAWIQFFPILIISIVIFDYIKSLIFSNQLVYTYKEVPWKKT